MPVTKFSRINRKVPMKYAKMNTKKMSIIKEWTNQY